MKTFLHLVPVYATEFSQNVLLWYGDKCCILLYSITHSFIYPRLNVTKFEGTFYLTFCLVKILLLIQIL